MARQSSAHRFAAGQATPPVPRFGSGACVGAAALGGGEWPNQLGLHQVRSSGQLGSIAPIAQSHRVTDGVDPVFSPGRATPTRPITPAKTPRRSSTPVPVAVESMTPQASSQGHAFQYGASAQHRAVTPRRDASANAVPPLGLQLNNAAGAWAPSLLGSSSLQGASHPILPGTATNGPQAAQQPPGFAFARTCLSSSPASYAHLPGMHSGPQPTFGADASGHGNLASNACAIRSVSPAYLRSG